MTLAEELRDKGVGLAAIQTVFEGSEVNTFDRLRENQRRYGLPVPFGHAVADLASVDTVPTIMEAYCSGGTPWFVVIAPDGRVVYDRSLLAADGLDNALLLPSPLLSKSVLDDIAARMDGAERRPARSGLGSHMALSKISATKAKPRR